MNGDDIRVLNDDYRIRTEAHCFNDQDEQPHLCLQCQGFPGFDEVLFEGHAGVHLSAPGEGALRRDYPHLRSLRRLQPMQTRQDLQIFLDDVPLLNHESSSGTYWEGLGLSVSEAYCSRGPWDPEDGKQHQGWVRIVCDHSKPGPIKRRCDLCGTGVCEKMLQGDVRFFAVRDPHRAIDDLARTRRVR